MERFNLACTSCYLTDVANRIRPLPFDEVDQQLMQLRRKMLRRLELLRAISPERLAEFNDGRGLGDDFKVQARLVD